MYCNPDSVRALAVNLREIGDEQISAVAEMVDAEIDSRLSIRYQWPFTNEGVDLRLELPAIVRTIANYLVAGQLEQQMTAQAVTIEGQGHPYGSTLRSQGKRALENHVEGSSRIPGVPTLGGPRVQQGQRGTGYVPVRSFSGRGRV